MLSLCNLFTVRNKVRQGSERPQGLPEKFLSLAARKIMGAELKKRARWEKNQTRLVSAEPQPILCNFLENFQKATRHGPCSDKSCKWEQSQACLSYAECRRFRSVVKRLPLTLHWKKLYISGRSNDNDNLLGIDYGGSHIVALQRSSERRKTKQGEERHQPFPLLTDYRTTAVRRLVCNI